MSETYIPAQKPDLDIGKVLSGTFGTFFSNVWYFVGTTFLYFLVIFSVLGGLFFAVFASDGFEALETLDDPDEFGSLFLVMAVFGIIYLLTYVGFMLFLARSAVTAYRGLGVQPGKAFASGFTALLPTVLFGLLLLIPLALGYMFFILPGLYLSAMFMALLPVLAYERSGFGALGRALDLTRGYHWPIVGLTVIWFFINFAIGTAFQMAIFAIFIPLLGAGLFDPTAVADGDMSSFIVAQLILQGLSMLSYCVLTPLGLIFPAVIYSRLVDVKEGGGTEELTAVFE